MLDTIRHAILMPTFNQEKYIEQSVLSVIENSKTKEFNLYISDDDSTDKTWEIIQNFQACYPDNIFCYRNKKNLGVFANLNQLMRLAQGDIFHFLAGDDLLAKHFFDNIDNIVTSIGVVPARDALIFCPRTLYLHPDGRLTAHLTHGLQKMRGTSLFSATLHRLYHSRNIGLTKAFFQKLPPYDAQAAAKVGPWYDFVHDLERIEFCSNIIFCSFWGNIYRQGSGLTTKYSNADLQNSFYRAVCFYAHESSYGLKRKFEEFDAHVIATACARVSSMHQLV